MTNVLIGIEKAKATFNDVLTDTEKAKVTLTNVLIGTEKAKATFNNVRTDTARVAFIDVWWE